MAEIDLGKISFTFKGVYAGGTTMNQKMWYNTQMVFNFNFCLC